MAFGCLYSSLLMCLVDGPWFSLSKSGTSSRMIDDLDNFCRMAMGVIVEEYLPSAFGIYPGTDPTFISLLR